MTETEPHEPGTTNPPTTKLVYDASDNLIKVTDAENDVIEYTYNARKQVLTTKDPRDLFTVNTYDTKGNLLSTKSGGTTVNGPFLSETTYTYDPTGNVETQTTTVGGVTHATGYLHDANGTSYARRTLWATSRTTATTRTATGAPARRRAVRCSARGRTARPALPRRC